MKWIAKQKSWLAAALVTAMLGACFMTSGISAKAESMPLDAGDGVQETAGTASLSARDGSVPAAPVVYFEAEPLANPVPLAEPAPESAAAEQSAGTEPDAPVFNPIAERYAAETVQSSASTTYIPENIAACTAGVEIPDDLEKIDSFIATAYTVTGMTSTGSYTTVGRTLAVNPNVIPYGTEVWMFLDDGTYIGTFIAEDTGSNMLAHSHVVDIYMGADSYDACIQWGAQHVNLYTVASE